MRAVSPVSILGPKPRQPERRGSTMEKPTLRLVIRSNLADGQLPLNSIPRIWGGPGNGEVCDACENIVTKDELLMEGISLAQGKRAIQFHTRCFYLWDVERRYRRCR